MNSRKKRKRILAQYDQIKSVSDKIFEEMKTGVAAIDKYGKIILVNSAFEFILDKHNLIEKQWNDIPESLIPSYSDLSENNLRVQENEIVINCNDTEKTLLVVQSKLINDEDENEGFVVVVNDITSLRELEQKSARKERLSEMGDLAAGIAHEIRNPLNTISIASQRLAGEFTPTDNKEEYLSFTKQIKDETKRLNTIITKFLALARGEEKIKTQINLTNLVVEFTNFISTEAKSLNIELRQQLDPEIYIAGDSDKVKQMLANLYNNSKEELHGASGVVMLSVTNQDDRVVLSFEDSGNGIPAELSEKIFTPYYTTKEAGTGLGLAIIYKIISDMHGEIAVTSSHLGGAKFTIIFA